MLQQKTPPWLWKEIANHPIVGVPKLSFLRCIFWDVVSQDRIKIFLPGFDPNPHVNVTSIQFLYWGSTSSLCLKFAFHSTNGRPWHAAMWPISPPAAHSLGNPGAKSHAHSEIGAKKLNQGTSCFQQKWLFFSHVAGVLHGRDVNVILSDASLQSFFNVVV